MEKHGARTSFSWLPRIDAPAAEQLRLAADVLNSSQRVAILAGQGTLSARAELEHIADLLGAPVAKALLGSTVISDNSPFSTGKIGHLGTEPFALLGPATVAFGIPIYEFSREERTAPEKLMRSKKVLWVRRANPRPPPRPVIGTVFERSATVFSPSR